MISKIMNSKLFKNISKLGFIIIGCFVLASFSPSLDGRAVVVEPGVFPEGLFAKTVGYLPGDIISVTNITGDSTIDILVIGALDPSEGVAIMLSPEAAEAIGINKNSNNIVKITKRSNQDERVYGAAVIATQKTAAEPVEPIPEVKEPEPVVYEPVDSEPVVEEAEEEIEEDFVEEPEEIFSTPVEEETPVYTEPVKEEEPVVEYEYFDDETLPDYAEEPESEPEYIETTVAEEPEPEEEPVEEYKEPESYVYEEFTDDELGDIPSDEEPIEEEPPVEEEPEEEVPAEEPVEDEITEEEPPIEEEFYKEDELAELEEEPVEETVPEETLEEPEPEEEADFEEEEFAAEEAPVEEEPAEEEFTDEPIEELIEDEVVEEPEETTDEPEVLEDEEEYDAIVLVPADDNPPVYANEFFGDTTETSDEVEVVTEEEIETESDVEFPAIELPVIEPVKNEVSVVQPAVTGKETDYGKFMIDSLDELEAEKYYIQIATLSDDENILEVVNKYGKKYPITIVPTAKGSKQILVGPVTLDEYGTVLARFKSYGYKDAFLRKGTNPNPKPRGSAGASEYIDAK